VIFFDIVSNTLLQTVAPDRLLGRARSVVSAVSWSTIPLGTFLGGVMVELTRSVALVYGLIGAVVILCALGFAFTAVGHAHRYLPPGKS
jgi:hypothetical protein